MLQGPDLFHKSFSRKHAIHQRFLHKWSSRLIIFPYHDSIMVWPLRRITLASRIVWVISFITNPHFGDYINPAKYTICHARNNFANIIAHTLTHQVAQSIIRATVILSKKISQPLYMSCTKLCLAMVTNLVITGFIAYACNGDSTEALYYYVMNLIFQWFPHPGDQ